MRIVTMKQDAMRRVVNQGVLASGTASGVWSQDQEPHAEAQPAKEQSAKLH
jgi:hypothetical protein